MHTSSAVLALTCSLFSVGANAPPIWHRDYGRALEVSQSMGRPVAIFVSPGEQMVNGHLIPAVEKILAEKYVCVVLDRTQDKDLVKNLAITKESGVVLSDRTGSVQAYHHDGQIRPEELVRRLSQYADPEVVVRTTQSNLNVRVSYYPNGSGNGNGASVMRPAAQSIRTVNC